MALVAESRGFRLVVLQVLAMACVCIGAGASAQTAYPPEKVEPRWKGLRFGWSREQVLEYMRAQIRRSFMTRIDQTLDTAQRDKFTREMRRALADVGKRLVSFNGKHTGWEASVIADEFVHGAGEEMLRIELDTNHYYLFFTKGVFYKLVLASVGVPVRAWIRRLTHLYGKPSRLVTADGTVGGPVVGATWNSGLSRVEVVDKTRLFQCVLLRWVFGPGEEASRKARENVGRGHLNPLVKQAVQPAERESEPNPVDEILGLTPEPGTEGKKDKNPRHTNGR